jgi:hypothetical protein
MKKSPMPKRRRPIGPRKGIMARKPIRARGATKAKKEARYKAYLSSPAWKAKRKEALERAGRRCEYLQALLQVLCKAHHELIEDRDHPTRRRSRAA